MVLTRNSAATLDQALNSVKTFAEIIVCDGHSTDATLDIAREHGAVVITQDPKFIDAHGRLFDFAGARHQVVNRATKPWIFHLDADEIATPALTMAIANIDDAAPASAYRCGARHIVDGTPIRSAANYPMTFLRVFRRDDVTGYSGPINEHPEFDDDAIIERIDGEFLMPMPPLRRVLRKWARYQRIVATNAFSSGNSDSAPSATELLRSELRVTKWLAWRIWKTHSCEEGPHMPTRYDSARVVFHLTMALNGFGARMLARAAQRARTPAALTREVTS